MKTYEFPTMFHHKCPTCGIDSLGSTRNGFAPRCLNSFCSTQWYYRPIISDLIYPIVQQAPARK